MWVFLISVHPFHEFEKGADDLLTKDNHGATYCMISFLLIAIAITIITLWFGWANCGLITSLAVKWCQKWAILLECEMKVDRVNHGRQLWTPVNSQLDSREGYFRQSMSDCNLPLWCIFMIYAGYLCPRSASAVCGWNEQSWCHSRKVG